MPLPLTLGPSRALLNVDPLPGLRVGLVGAWRLGEASGTRADSVGTNPLTDNNSVGQAAGVLGNAASFTRASNQFLSHADAAALSWGDNNGTLAAWVYLASKPAGDMHIVGQFTGGSRGYTLLWVQASDRFRWVVYDSGGTGIGVVSATTFGAPALNTWYWLRAWVDTAQSKVFISVNNGPADNAALAGTINDATSTFEIGNTAAASGAWDGRMQLVDKWTRILTSAEAAQVYNNGSGLVL